MGYVTPTDRSLHQAIPNGSVAKTLGPGQRLSLGVQALAGHHTITGLAKGLEVSRKFVYRQTATAKAALHAAFKPAGADDEVLFYLPVTKAWLRQVVLGLVLICHSSLRGVIEFLRDLFDVKMALGTVHNILRAAVNQARPHNDQADLAGIANDALDEIFQKRRPVLVGADVASTYCFLLSPEDHRDADTWALRLLELQDRGFAPKATIADFGTGLRAGHRLALPNVPCRGDVFHALHDVSAAVRIAEARAYEAIEAGDQLDQQKRMAQWHGRSITAFSQKTRQARQTQAQAIALADDLALLARWLRDDVLIVSGPSYADRCVLFDFVVAELKRRERSIACLRSVRRLLENHRDELLAFAVQLDRDLADLAQQFQVAEPLVRELLLTHDPRQPRRWQRQASLRAKLRDRFWPLSQAVRRLASQVVRASSVIENLNSRLRPYFFLRRHLGKDYLVLLQFFLNHRRFLRSHHAHRIGKSPAELLNGPAHAHWLELLGHQRFRRA